MSHVYGNKIQDKHHFQVEDLNWKEYKLEYKGSIITTWRFLCTNFGNFNECGVQPRAKSFKQVDMTWFWCNQINNERHVHGNNPCISRNIKSIKLRDRASCMLLWGRLILTPFRLRHIILTFEEMFYIPYSRVFQYKFYQKLGWWRKNL